MRLQHFLAPFLALAAATAAFGQDSKAQKLEIKALPGGVMKYDKADYKVKAGQPIEMTFSNPDVLPHNVIILKPGTKDKVGALADAMITDPKGMEKSYIPASPDILHSTKLVQPSKSETLTFTIKDPGSYPILCTFPGHWRLMNAVLIVEK